MYVCFFNANKVAFASVLSFAFYSISRRVVYSINSKHFSRHLLTLVFGYIYILYKMRKKNVEKNNKKNY